MLAALLPLRAPAFSPASHVAMSAAPEAFAHPLLPTPGLGKGRSTRQPAPVERSRRAVAASPRARPRASAPRLSMETDPAPAPADAGRARGYGDAEDKALRLCRTSFGGYPAGAYYELEQADPRPNPGPNPHPSPNTSPDPKPNYALEQAEGLGAAYALVRLDHAALSDWSDAEIGLALKELKTTPLEVRTLL